MDMEKVEDILRLARERCDETPMVSGDIVIKAMLIVMLADLKDEVKKLKQAVVNSSS